MSYLTGNGICLLYTLDLDICNYSNEFAFGFVGSILSFLQSPLQCLYLHHTEKCLLQYNPRMHCFGRLYAFTFPADFVGFGVHTHEKRVFEACACHRHIHPGQTVIASTIVSHLFPSSRVGLCMLHAYNFCGPVLIEHLAVCCAVGQCHSTIPRMVWRQNRRRLIELVCLGNPQNLSSIG